MRRTFGLWILISVFCGGLQAASVTVSQPAVGVNLIKGKTFSVRWTTVNITATVRLVLYQGSAKLGPIVTAIPSSQHAYVWTVGQYQGGTAPTGDDYFIRVRTEATDDADAVAGDSGRFAIIPDLPGLPGGGIPDLGLKILEPTGGTWTVGDVLKVAWKADSTVKYPISAWLETADHQSLISDLGQHIAAGLPGHPLGAVHQWSFTRTIPPNIPKTATYCVRLTSSPGSNGRRQVVHSAPIAIRTTRTVMFDLEPDRVVNKSRAVRVTVFDTTWGSESFESTPDIPKIPDPGGRTLCFGYQRANLDDNYFYRVYRSYAHFDLNAVMAQLKGKATVTSAILVVKKTSGQSCPPTVLCLDAALNVDNHDLLCGPLFDSIPKHPLVHTEDYLQAAQRWLDAPFQNFGLVVRDGRDLNHVNNGQTCLQFAALTLSLHIEEKLNH